VVFVLTHISYYPDRFYRHKNILVIVIIYLCFSLKYFKVPITLPIKIDGYNTKPLIEYTFLVLRTVFCHNFSKSIHSK